MDEAASELELKEFSELDDELEISLELLELELSPDELDEEIEEADELDSLDEMDEDELVSELACPAVAPSEGWDELSDEELPEDETGLSDEDELDDADETEDELSELDSEEDDSVFSTTGS